MRPRGGALDAAGPMARAEGEACLQAAGIDAVSIDDDWAAAATCSSCSPVPGTSARRDRLAEPRPGLRSIETDYLTGEIVLLGRPTGSRRPSTSPATARQPDSAEGPATGQASPPRTSWLGSGRPLRFRRSMCGSRHVAPGWLRTMNAYAPPRRGAAGGRLRSGPAGHGQGDPGGGHSLVPAAETPQQVPPRRRQQVGARQPGIVGDGVDHPQRHRRSVGERDRHRRFSSTIGDGAIRASSAYSAAICGQSVFPHDEAVGQAGNGGLELVGARPAAKQRPLQLSGALGDAIVVPGAPVLSSREPGRPPPRHARRAGCPASAGRQQATRLGFVGHGSTPSRPSLIASSPARVAPARRPPWPRPLRESPGRCRPGPAAGARAAGGRAAPGRGWPPA